MRPRLFHRLLSSHTCPLVGSRSPYAGGFFAAAFSGSSPLPWPAVSLSTSAPSFSLVRANISTLQDSLNVTGCEFASLSPGVTTLQHHQSPDGTGCLLHGGLTLTVTGLPPASRRWLCRTHQRIVVLRLARCSCSYGCEKLIFDLIYLICSANSKMIPSGPRT